MDIPQFSNLSEKKTLDGDKVKIDDVLNKSIIITGYQIMTSKYKTKSSEHCTKVQFYFASDEREERKVFFSGSLVIKDQVEEMDKKLSEKGLPFVFQATVKKVGNYYSLT